MNNKSDLEEKFTKALRYQLAGLKTKVLNDFSKKNYEKELNSLIGDSLYSKFYFASPEYVLIRFMGRISISIGRRLGEIYDKIPRIITALRYNIDPDKIAPVIKGLELDIGIKLADLANQDSIFVKETVRKYTGTSMSKGIGIEIRYNFNPNDSSRLRKDCKMAENILNIGYVPVYLVFSSISPREEAIARLKRAGWHFLIGDEAVKFSETLLGLNLAEILDKETIKKEIQNEVSEIMKSMINSYAFQTVLSRYKEVV